MRDLPVFTTQNGVGSLTLEEIPYNRCAYIRVQDASSPQNFLRECADFCVAVGAEYVYATGVGADNYPFYNAILHMYRTTDGLPDTDAFLCPVTEATLEQWRSIYNTRMSGVSNVATMTINKAQKALAEGICYYVYRDSSLLGIGMASGAMINAIVSVVPGSGKDVLLALCGALTGDTVCVEVSSTNQPALSLYKKLGFVEIGRIADWYQII